MAGIDIFAGGSVDPRLAAEAARLGEINAGKSAEGILQAAITEHFKGDIALVSSFGADSAVLLQLVADVDRAVPVLFIDTGRHFAATLAYRDRLVERIGLSDVRTIRPRADLIDERDPDLDLYHFDPDSCCGLRKVEPLARALAGFGAWITGRKRHQAATRAELAVFEAEETRIKVNPLAGWRRADIDAFLAERELPAHPLYAEGYKSIGCEVCTTRVAPGEDERAGRWRGTGKTECGIHLKLPPELRPEEHEQ